MVLNPGMMNTPMLLRKPAPTTRSSSGEPTRTYVDTGIVWVEVFEQHGREFMAARQMNQGLSAMFRMHYQSDVTSGWQGEIDGEDYNFTSVVNPRRRNEELVIEAEKAE